MIITLFIASIIGLIAGVFGSGSGLVGVPLLANFVEASKVNHNIVMHVATGTILALSVLTMLTATITQNKYGAINWILFIKLFFPINLGVVLGSIIANQINNNWLYIIFGILVFILACSNLRNKKSINHNDVDINHWKFYIGSFLVATTIGLSGFGVFVIIYMKKFSRLSLHSSIATFQAIGISTSLFGAVSYILLGMHDKNLPSLYLGYCDLSVLIPLSIGSIIFTRLGVIFSHKLSQNSLAKTFNIFLFVMALYMMVVGVQMLMAW